MSFADELAELIAQRSPEFEQIARSWRNLCMLMKYWFNFSKAEFFNDVENNAFTMDECAQRIVSQFKVL